MHTTSNIIDLRPYLPPRAAQTPGWEARRRRTAKRSRSAAIRTAIVTAAEVIASLAIGLCVLLSTGAFLQML